jgi:hypothetical protein
MFNYQKSIYLVSFFFFKAMDDRGIIACSETEYFAYDRPTSNDRRSIGSFNSIFKLDDPNTSTCFTNISSVNILAIK